MGFVSGWLLHASFSQSDSVDLSLVQRLCPEFELNSKDAFDLNLNSSANVKTSTNCRVALIEESEGLPEHSFIIDQIIKGREITPNELKAFSHWNSFEQFVNQFNYSDSEVKRLFAKAEIYFHKNYVGALELLYSAIDAASSEQEINTIQGESNALINFVREKFFSLESSIADSHFVQLMELANEKVPGYLPVILALIKHYLLMGDYTLVENYIGSIPTEAENQSMIALMNQRLVNTKEDKGEILGGIPMRKIGTQYVVKVNINDDISLNLLLDTGASRTALPLKTIQDMQQVSNDVIDLKMQRYARTANGRAHVNLYQAKTLEVGGFVLANPLILSVNLFDDKEMHGLLGMDFLGKFQFRIDHEKALLYLSH